MLFHENDDIYIYYNRVLVQEAERFADSWFNLVCRNIDQVDDTPSSAHKRSGVDALMLVLLLVSFLVNRN